MDAGDVNVIDGVAFTTWRNVAINVWGAGPSVQRLRALRTAFRALKERYPRTATITVLDADGLPSLTPEEREEAAAMARDTAGTTIAVAHVLEASGFSAAARRMVLSGVMLLSRPRYPHKTFDSAAGAARWIAEQIAPPAERVAATMALTDRIEAARARLR
jgi:hypothetical protein